MIRVRTDFSRATNKLQTIQKGVRRSLPEVLESEGRICAVSLAKSTQPFGTGRDAQDMGERAVSRDIAKVYKTIGDVFSKLPTVGEGDARQFWKLVNLGKFDAAQDILTQLGSQFASIPIGEFDDGALHRHARSTSTGRVTQKNPSLIVTDARSLMSYAQKEIDLVGFAKSAWATIARQLGGIRGLRAPKLPGGERDITANWITRKGAPGVVLRDGFDGSRPRLTLTSKVRYADQVLSESAKTNAIRIARDRIAKQSEIAARYEMKGAVAA